MEQSPQYPSMHPRHHLFHSSQLPPPSQLHLPMPSSFPRSNTLPPIPSLQPAPQPHSFPPINPYHNPTSLPQQSLPPLPPSPTSQHPWPTLHRTSNSREELYPPQQSTLPRSDPRPPPLIKHEPGSGHRSFTHSHESQSLQHQQHLPQPVKESGNIEDGMPSTSDFVKKLYKMLEDQSFQHVVSWGPHGDCFVVKDMNEFTKSILPRMFKHSNFASFVRQLNKYDFHKARPISIIDRVMHLNSDIQIKNTDDNNFGEHSWTFRHPDFHADRRDALENIKRKVPAQRKSLPQPTTNSSALNDPTSTSPGPYSASSAPSNTAVAVDALQAQVDRLTHAQEDMSAHVRDLERNYHDVLAEMVNFQRNIAQQDGLIQNLIQYFLQVENGKVRDQNSAGGGGSVNTDSSDQNPFLPTQEAQRMMGSYPESDVARASLIQMNEISRRAEVAGMSFGNGDPDNGNSGGIGPGRHTPRILAAAAAGIMGWDPTVSKPMSRQDTLARIEELQRSRPTSAHGSGDEAFVLPEDSATGETREVLQRWLSQSSAVPSTHQGLQVYTLGHLMPRSTVDDANGNWSFDADSLGMTGRDTTSGATTPPIAGGAGVAGTSLPESSTYSASEPPAANAQFTDEETVNPSPPIPGQEPRNLQKLRVRRSTFVPGWAVPPRVLLVDDDAVSRKLSSKFLQVFGCTIDVAVDGVGAVNKMNLEKYDLVLMDIVMPKLDGVSATSLIRQFDHMTPIISMTSNSKPDEIMTYYSSGMNDILPKPFTKEGLLDMLEKHLMHLKVIQQMSKVPRTIGMEPIADGTLDEPLTSSTTDAAQGSNRQLVTMDGTSMVSSNNVTGLDDDGRINPLAGLGLTNEQYATILHNMVNGEPFSGITLMNMNVGEAVTVGEKRSLEDADDPREVKRSRFELVE